MRVYDRAVIRRIRKAIWRSIQAVVEHSSLQDSILFRLPTTVDGVALTFDDGPKPESTPRILDMLAATGARASFFLVGERARRYPALVRRIVGEGHAVGNHTYSHIACTGLPPEVLQRELEGADEAIRTACPEVGSIPFRPPHGRMRPGQAWRLVQGGRRLVLWSRDSRDINSTASQILDIADHLRPREIVLLHDAVTAMLDALPAILNRLQMRGLPPVSLDKLSAHEAIKASP